MSDRSKRGGAASAAQRTRTPALSRRRFGILVIPYLWLVVTPVSSSGFQIQAVGSVR